MPGKLCKTVHNLHGKWQRRQNRRIKISFTGTSKTKFWHEKRANVVVIYLMLQVFTAHTTTGTHNSTHKHTHKHTFSHNKTNTHKRPAKCLKSHRQSQWPTQQNERRKNEFFWPGQNRYEIRVQFSTDEGGEKKGEREGDRLLNLCGISRHFKRSTDIDIESMPWHSLCLPRIRGVYVMRECVWRHK